MNDLVYFKLFLAIFDILFHIMSYITETDAN